MVAVMLAALGSMDQWRLLTKLRKLEVTDWQAMSQIIYSLFTNYLTTNLLSLGIKCSASNDVLLF